MDIEESRADKFLNLTIMHNMAMCYQKIGALDECALYLEGCLLNLSSCFAANLEQNPEEKLKKMKYECKVHMQVCALLSQLHRHKEALNHAKSAMRFCHFLIHDITAILAYYSKDEKRDKIDSDLQLDYFFEVKQSLLSKTAPKILPILEEIEKRMIGELAEPVSANAVPASDFTPSYDKCDLRNLLGYLN